MTRAAAIALLLICVGCTTVAAPVNPREIWCDNNRPHNYSAATLATFTRAEIDAENNYQDQGVTWCKWVVK